jgi:hypothetical protein
METSIIINCIASIMLVLVVCAFIFYIWGSIFYSTIVVRKIEFTHDKIISFLISNREFYKTVPHKCCFFNEDQLNNVSLAKERMELIKQKISDLEQKIQDNE